MIHLSFIEQAEKLEDRLQCLRYLATHPRMDTQYKALKGNGDMRDLRKTFRHLPMIPGGMPTEVSDDD